ncbi:hypothetical protein IW140_003933 [Coemansia sp. RSA 1813]|nr:hypothetical protein IW138_004080 [Coemansia sp. RSA 986]KAJ2568390.1 hypothetical protein IW140_003933 [Coemansia sp. RSA 1813]
MLATIGKAVLFSIALYKAPTNNLGSPFRAEYRLTWQDPFIYEAKMYVSTEQFVPSNETQFFEKAELVWRSGQQSIENKFPHFRGKATVQLPKSLSLDTDSAQHDLYAHIFVQEASDVESQNPNLDDPLLIHSMQPVVWWKPQKNNTFQPSSSHGYPYPPGDQKSNADHQLVSARSVSWGMTMEPNAVRMISIGGGCRGNKWLTNDASSTQHHLLDHNPSIFKNLITRSVPHVDVLLAHRKDGALPQSIEVEVDVQGIKQYMIAIKLAMLSVTSHNFMTCPRLNPSYVMSGSYFDYKNSISTNDASEDPDLATRYSYNLSVLKLLTMIFAIMTTMVSALFTAKICISYWIGPKSKWIGMSRASFVFCLINVLLIVLRKVKNDEATLWDKTELFGNVYILLVLLGRSLNPLVWVKYIIRIVKGRRNERIQGMILPTRIGLTSEWQPSEEEDMHGFKKPMHESGLNSNQVAKIVAIRKQVDNAVLQRSRSFVIVLLAIFSLYSLYHHNFSPFSVDYIGDVLYYMQVMAMWLRYVPQLVVNYRTRSAEHTPVIDHLQSVATTIVGTLMCRFASIYLWDEISVQGGVLYAANIQVNWNGNHRYRSAQYQCTETTDYDLHTVAVHDGADISKGRYVIYAKMSQGV